MITVTALLAPLVPLNAALAYATDLAAALFVEIGLPALSTSTISYQPKGSPVIAAEPTPLASVVIVKVSASVFADSSLVAPLPYQYNLKL